MQFYNSVGPNPRIVRMFAAERGITLPSVQVDLRGGENRQPAYLAKNRFGLSDTLALDWPTLAAGIPFYVGTAAEADTSSISTAITQGA